jgi:hypothetical protein
MHGAIPGSDVSIAIPGVAYPGYDIAGLAAACDTLMIMSYDFHYAGSDPGPVAPLADSSEWRPGSQTSSVALFKGQVANAKQLVLGMPLYGYDYQATSNAVPGTHVAGTTATAIEWKNCPALATMYGRQWDAASSTPYVLYQQSGAWRQLWYEDPESVGLKIDLAVASDLGGIGLWNLTYADDTFWAVVRAKLSSTPTSDGGLASDGGGGGSSSDGGAPADPATPPPSPPRPIVPAHGCSVAGHGSDGDGSDGGAWPLVLALVACAVTLARRRRVTGAARS